MAGWGRPVVLSGSSGDTGIVCVWPDRGPARSWRGWRRARVAPSDPFRARAHRPSPPRPCRQRHLRLGAGGRARRTRPAAHRGSRSAAGSPRVRSGAARRSRLAGVRAGRLSVRSVSRRPLRGPAERSRSRVSRRAWRRSSRRGLVYGCDCTRKQLTEGPYPGTCRDRGLPLARRRRLAGSPRPRFGDVRRWPAWTAAADARRAVWRRADPRSARQLDLSVGGDDGRRPSADRADRARP